MAEDAEVGSETSSTTRSAKNLPSDMAKDAEVGGNGDGGDNETDKRLPSRKSSRLMRYFISLRSNADSVLFAKIWLSLDSFGYGWGSQLEAPPKLL